MKINIIAALLVATFACTVQAGAQFRQRPSDEPSAAGSFVHPATADAWLGFFNPENFTMQHSYSMSYSAMGSQGIALGRYTNSMQYKFSDKLDARVAVSMQHSPYSSFDQRLQSSLTGIFVDRAEINYRPTDNTLLRISYRQLPAYYGYNGMYGYNSPFMMGYSGYESEGY